MNNCWSHVIMKEEKKEEEEGKVECQLKGSVIAFRLNVNEIRLE